jgi:hypothetical protein
MKKYKQEDVNQQRRTRAFLKKLCSIKKEARDRDLKDYCKQASATSKSLRDKRQLNEYVTIRLFLMGLPNALRERVIRALSVDPKDSGTMVFKPIYDKTMTFLKTQEAMEFFS